MWRLPLHPEYDDLIKGTYGDITNLSKEPRKATSITAAHFLSRFVGDTPWAHIDIAGTAYGVGRSYTGKGGSASACGCSWSSPAAWPPSQTTNRRFATLGVGHGWSFVRPLGKDPDSRMLRRTSLLALTVLIAALAAVPATAAARTSVAVGSPTSSR